MKSLYQLIGLTVLVSIGSVFGQSLQASPVGETAHPQTHIQKPRDIFLSTWQTYNRKYQLFSDTMLTGNYHDVDFINAIAQDIFTANDSGRMIWYPVDLICAYSGTYFESFIPPDDKWREVDTSQPLELLNGMLKQGEPSNLAMSYVEPVNDSLSAILVFRGQYRSWFQIFRRQYYALILAFSRDGERLLGQYQVLDLKPNFIYNPLTKFPMHVLAHDLFLDDLQPGGLELIKIRRDYIAQSQTERDRLFHWFLTGPHMFATEENYKPKPGGVFDYPENWVSLTAEQRNLFFKNALSPEKWRVIAAEVQVRPYFFSYDYKFTLQSRQNKDEQLSVIFNLSYGSYKKSGDFKAARMVKQAVR